MSMLQGMAALALALELAAPAVTDDRVDLREGCFEQQTEFWDCSAPTKAMMCGRRAGKSSVALPWLIDGAIDNEGTVNPFIDVTRAHAKLNFWDLAKRIADRSGVSHKVNEAELTIRFEGGGLFFLGGADKANELEKYRGLKVYRAFVDECGIMPSSSLVYLLEEVLEPATADMQGQIGLGGTPGPTKSGEWFEITRPDSTRGIPTFRWTMEDNPHIAHATVWLTDLRKRRGWTEDTPKYVREYKGQWCEDPGELVFPLGEHNWIDEVPTRSAHGKTLSLGLWSYVLGVDVGASPGATAIVGVATHPDLACDYIIHAEKHVGWIASQLGQRLHELVNGSAINPPRFPGAAIVVDTGGMGKVHALELQRRQALPFEPAQKTEKASQVDITRDRVITGRVKVLRGPATAPLRDEWAVLGWAEDSQGNRKTDSHGTPYPNPDAENHCTDAGLYGLRRLWNYNDRDGVPRPEEGSAEALAQEEDRMLQAAIRRASQEDEGPWPS